MSSSLRRGHWLALGAAAFLCGLSALGMRLFPVAESTLALTARRAERVALEAYDDATMLALRERVSAMALRGWNEERIRRWQSSLGSDWQWRIVRQDASWYEGIVERGGLPVSEWKTVVAFVERLEREPGLTVVAVEIGAMGSSVTRRFSAVRFTVLLRTQ